MGEDRVYLRVPAKPEYILVIRLTTSAVATRAGFDVDEIEDIKVAVAEAGTVITHQKNRVGTIELSYKIAGVNGIWIHISAPETEEVTIPYTENEQAELSFYIMESLMDNVERNEKDGFIRELKMYKEFGG